MNVSVSVAIVAKCIFTEVTLAKYVSRLFMLSSYKKSDGKKTMMDKILKGSIIN